MAGQPPVVVVPGGEFAVVSHDRRHARSGVPCYLRRLCQYRCLCDVIFSHSSTFAALGARASQLAVSLIQDLGRNGRQRVLPDNFYRLY